MAAGVIVTAVTGLVQAVGGVVSSIVNGNTQKRQAQADLELVRENNDEKAFEAVLAYAKSKQTTSKSTQESLTASSQTQSTTIIVVLVSLTVFGLVLITIGLRKLAKP